MHESNQKLLDISLVRRIRDDPSIRINERHCDASWIYDVQKTNLSMGWTPFRGEICINRGSPLSAWLHDPAQDLRKLNEGDFFIKELMFAVHDYLHIWAVGEIRNFVPDLDFATVPLDSDNIEEQLLAMLITEAVATTGLDYWQLCQHDLRSSLAIGSNFRTLTVSYDEKQKQEYEAFAPDFQVNHHSFLGILSRFYATGAFPAFGTIALQRSPCIFRWLEHELTYGQLQRRYSRLWLQHLSGQTIYERADLTKPISVDVPWFNPLVEALGERLWALVQGNDSCPIRSMPDPDDTWSAPERGPIDFRFTNLNAFDDPEKDTLRRGVKQESRSHWREQVLRTKKFPAGDRYLVQSLIKLDDDALFHWSARQLPSAPETSREDVKDMFFLK